MAWALKPRVLPRVIRDRAECPECGEIYLRSLLSACRPTLGEEHWYMCNKCKTHFVSKYDLTAHPTKGRASSPNEVAYKNWVDVINKARRERNVAVEDCGALHSFFSELVGSILKGESVEVRASKAKELLDGRFSAYAE